MTRLNVGIFKCLRPTGYRGLSTANTCAVVYRQMLKPVGSNWDL
jgi:hypothetical protein